MNSFTCIRSLVLVFSLSTVISAYCDPFIRTNEKEEEKRKECTRGTKDDVYKMVKLAVQYYRKHGAEQAFHKFNYDPHPDFFDCDIFIGVAEQKEEGVVLANPHDLDLVNTKVKNGLDAAGASAGKAVIKKVVELKAAGKRAGWLRSFYFINPINDEPERKRIFIYLYDNYIFASGFYKIND